MPAGVRVDLHREGRRRAHDGRVSFQGRKNFLFVGHDEAGANLATLQTLVSSCLANEVNPQAYLTDVLLRIDSTPRAELNSLLPWNWRAPPQQTD